MTSSNDVLAICPLLQKEVIQCFCEEKNRRPTNNSVHRCSPRPRSNVSPLPSKRNIDNGAGSLRILTAETDLSYMDSKHPVGSYNSDKCSSLTLSDNVDDDCVRCICGVMEDDGVMTQCDKCHFWLHADCLDFEIDSTKEFVCDFCNYNIKWTPNVDIVLRPQPDIKFSGCVYYRTLVNTRGIQVRVNEAVYVERLINDEHKHILRKLHEQCKLKSQANSNYCMSTKLEKQCISSSTKTNLKEHKQGSDVKNLRNKAKNDRKHNSKSKESANSVLEKKSKKEKNENDCNMNKSETTIESTRIQNNWWPSINDLPSSSLKMESSNSRLNDTKLQETNYQLKEYNRKDLRTFRIERIFTGPNGKRFVFGVYYARPHETFCDSNRMFYKNELFWTPLFDTLPLDSVVGRCLILEPQIWSMGRPKSPKYLEEDVFICEYQIDRSQRCFEKILPKNRYAINTENYVFDHFPKQLPLRRDFTPFIMPISNTLTKIQSASPIFSEKSKSLANAPSTVVTSTPTVVRPTAGNKERGDHLKLITKQISSDHLESICKRIQQNRLNNNNKNI